MGLNPAQQAAVEHESGPLLVLAGAGSGKTKVITQRIARLVKDGVAPEAILAVTFTNKAAGEMAERLALAIGHDRANALWLSTFHSFGVRFLTEESASLNYGTRFVIFDQGDSMGLMRDLMRRMRANDRRLDLVAIAARISLWKNKFIAPAQVEVGNFEYDEAAAEIYPAYEEALRSMRAFDFDDLVVAPVRLLERNEQVRRKWQTRFRHVLVDEFQDTNKAQLALVQNLANDLGNVCVVGDDDQSIYGWRGADVTNILEFERHFRRAKIVKLETNYRSRAPILAVANAIIQDSKHNRHEKTLRSARGDGDRVRLCIAIDAEAEAKQVVSEIKELARSGQRYREIAVLYRSNGTAKLLEEEMRAEGVPYRVFGGSQYFDRKEIKDVLAYLRAAIYPYDEISLRRIVNHPPRGIGATSLDRLSSFAETHGLSFGRVFATSESVPDLPKAARAGMVQFNEMLRAAQRAFASGQLAIGARQLVHASGLEQYIANDEGPRAKKSWANIEWLLGRIARYEQTTSRPDLGELLQRLSLASNEEEVVASEQVTLATLHASKGLEFDNVFLVGCVEGQLPHSRTTDPRVSEAAPTDVEEERRLFYVGVTRARERLYLMRSQRRALRGKITELTPSRFLDSIPVELTEVHTPPCDAELTKAEVAEASRKFLEQLFGDR